MPRNFSRAFTLIELLVVIAIIAILASLAYPVFTGVQGATPNVTFIGTAATAVTVDKAGGGSQGTALGRTHNNRKRIDARMADLHVENVLWSVFMNTTNSSSDPSTAQRWAP